MRVYQIFTVIYVADQPRGKLLSVTRLEEGRLNLNMSAELVDEVVQEARVM